LDLMPPRSLFAHFIVFAAVVALTASSLSADVPQGPILPPLRANTTTPPPTPIAPVQTSSFADWEQILRALAVSMIPQDYENTKDWGKTKKTFDGVKADTNKGYLRLSKHESVVRHGLWKRYRVTLIDPDKTLKLALTDLGEANDRRRIRISSEFRAAVQGRVELWTLGVKGLNGEVRGTGAMRIDVLCNYRIASVVQDGFPALRLVPEIERINLTLVEYTADKIGVFKGELAEAAGDGSRAVLREIVDAQEKTLLRKARKAVAEQQDRLTLSPAQWWFSGDKKPTK
jgi:hypothetical protein